MIVITDIREIKSGVSQKSVLGPFLYFLYTEDLSADPKIPIAIFADDTMLFIIYSTTLTQHSNIFKVT
jgi:hypothetical protein